MNNRIPIAVLALLVLVALVWRIANPPPPPPPGPLGNIPAWDSRTKIGEMSASAVNPSGTMWAGAWNQKTRTGELRSAVLVIDLEKQSAFRQEMKRGWFVSSLGWRDDRTVWALLVDSADPTAADKAKIAYLRGVGSEKPKLETASLKTAAARILAWPAGSDKLLAQIAAADRVRVGVFSDSGEPLGRLAEVELPVGMSNMRCAAISADGKLFVFSVAEDKIGGKISYYLGDSDKESLRKVFASSDLPGRVEGMWVSAAGVLVVCANRENFRMLVYRPETPGSAPTPISMIKGAPVDVARDWPDAPASMMFATYNGGYELNLRTGRIKRLFDLTKLDRMSDHWRRQIQDGRLYSRTDGDYTAVSVVADEVDIRIIRKSGDKGPDILPRG